MKSKNKKIDELLRKERLKIIAGLISVIIPVIAILAYLYVPPMGSQEIIFGEVVTLTASQHDKGHTLYILVQTEAGKEVRVLIHNSARYKKGHRVKLLKIEPLFFGRTIYKFRGYVPSNA